MTLRFFYALLTLGALCLFGGCGKSPEDKLIEASAAGNVQEIQRLLSLGVNVNCVSRALDKSTPLIWAVAQRREKAVTALLAAGADPNLRDAHGKTALFYAFSNQEDLSGIIKPLVLAGANTVEYKAMFATLPENNPNRVAFEQASKERMASKQASRP